MAHVLANCFVFTLIITILPYASMSYLIMITMSMDGQFCSMQTIPLYLLHLKRIRSEIVYKIKMDFNEISSRQRSFKNRIKSARDKQIYGTSLEIKFDVNNMTDITNVTIKTKIGDIINLIRIWRPICLTPFSKITDFKSLLLVKCPAASPNPQTNY